MTTRIEDCNLRTLTIRCLTDAWADKHDIIMEHWGAADNLAAFKSSVFADERLRGTKAYAELSKETDGHWRRTRDMFGAKCLKTESDAGSVKVGNDAFSVRINNGRGDGVTRIAIFERGDAVNPYMMRYSGTSLHGTFYIYSYDGDGGIPVVKLNGDYDAYIYDGLVAFVAQR